MAMLCWLQLLAVASVSATHISGRSFDRFVSVWLGEQDFDALIGNVHLEELTEQGILLTSYFANSHPSQPNYLAAIAGDYFGLNHDEPLQVPINVSTVVDLLDWRELSWKAYMEDLPGPGYMGDASDSQAGDDGWNYVRQHNPFVTFDSINLHGDRLLNIVSFEDLKADISEDQLPQYAFITPNLVHSGRNSTPEDATRWANDFLSPLIAQTEPSMRTLIILTCDEAKSRGTQNQVFSLLLGSAIPSEWRGTRDDTFYTHFSMLSTVEFNWELPHLGRYDVGANIYQFVQDLGSRVTVPNKDPPNRDMVNNSESYPGAFNQDVGGYLPIPPPNLGLTGISGLPILELVSDLWSIRKDEDSPYDGNGTVYDVNYQPVYQPQAAQKPTSSEHDDVD